MNDSPDHQTVTWCRDLPVRYDADVAVIGGGIAGACAAAAAAAGGARVLLVERFAVTGGMMTVGGVGNWCGPTRGQGEVFDEILSGLEAFGALDPPRQGAHGAESRIFDHEILAVVLQELLLRRGVKLLLHARFADARGRDGRITECAICGQSGLEALRARQFVDCTGEGQVARAAGLATMNGREPDGAQIAMSLMYFLRETPEPPGPQVPEGWFEAIRSPEELPMTSVWPNGPGGKALKVKVPGFDSSDTESMTAAEVHGRRRMMAVLDYYQRVENRSWRFDHCSPIIGIREGRRIVGDYVLTADDLRAGRAFDDGVARGTFWLDAISSDDDKRTYLLPEDQRRVPPYQIPLRALIARDGRNLMMAGRCFSCDQLALSSARVATTGAMMGQAAGIAAALAATRRCDPRDLDPREVHQLVRDRGAVLDV